MLKIFREPYIDEFVTDDIESYIAEGYDITLEGSYDCDTGKENWYCELYCGDSNSPWKTGTISGFGYGKTLEEALKYASDSLEIVTGYERVEEANQPKKSRFSSEFI